ncbi:MAG: fused MFS/spermidine synthase [Gammaproteobacteria bacterium]
MQTKAPQSYWIIILLVIYTLSGVTALSYEVLWARMFALQFGVSIFGVVITVAAFMFGLGLGSLAISQRRFDVATPLLMFSALETGIAIYALALPKLMPFVDEVVTHLDSSSAYYSWLGTEVISALAMMLLPATAMGASFPLILRAVRSTQLSLAKIYGLNTLGGALGALVPLLLLPNYGWSASINLIALLGILIGFTAFTLSRLTQPSSVTETVYVRPGLKFLIPYAGLGAAALILQIGWTRLYGMIMLRTEYVLAIILAVFLLGTALGSLLVRRTPDRRWLDYLPVWAGIFSLVSLWGFPFVSAWLEQQQFNSLNHALVSQGLVLVALTIPVTLALGAWLPLLTEHLGRQDHSGPWLYGANSIGAALGALSAGFLLIPLLGTTTTIVLAACSLFVFGMCWSRVKSLWLAVVLLMALAWPVLEFPGVNQLLPDLHADSNDIYLNEDAISITHVIEQKSGQRILLSDLQRMDASSEPTAVISQQNQARLPLLLHPDPRKVLFLGLGTGISAAGALDFPGLTITAVELSKGAIEAAADEFSLVNNDIVSHAKVIRDDARRFLSSGYDDHKKQFDVIIGDVFHPDFVGRSNLLSVQQFERARNHLTDNGLFVQWLALNQFDIQSLKIILRSFHRIFPDGVIFIDGFRLALVGSKAEKQWARDLLAHVLSLSSNDQLVVTGGEGEWSWLGRYLGPVDVGAGAVQDEWSPRIEFYLPRARYRGDIDIAKVVSWLLSRRPDRHEAASQLQLKQRELESFQRAYVANEMAIRSWVKDLSGSVAESQQLIRLAYQANSRDRWIAMTLADKMFATLSNAIEKGFDQRQALLKILDIYPDHVEALRALWKMESESGDQQRASNYMQRLKSLTPMDKMFR